MHRDNLGDKRAARQSITPRMKPGDGITGTAAAERSPIMIPAQAHLDERFKAFPNLPAVVVGTSAGLGDSLGPMVQSDSCFSALSSCAGDFARVFPAPPPQAAIVTRELEPRRRRRREGAIHAENTRLRAGSKAC